MPNWVSNALKVIKGDPKEVFELIRTEQSVFAFNKLIPMPESIWICNEEVIRASGFKSVGLVNRELGNQVECLRSQLLHDRSGAAWDPPLPVFEAASVGVSAASAQVSPNRAKNRMCTECAFSQSSPHYTVSYGCDARSGELVEWQLLPDRRFKMYGTAESRHRGLAWGVRRLFPWTRRGPPPGLSCRR
jgi:hypothetical protein